MEKKFWVCRADGEPVSGYGIGLEFAVAFDTRRDAERYIRMNDDLHPPLTWTILEVWQKEVE